MSFSHNLKQIRKIIQFIDMFQKQEIELGGLIGTIEFLLSNIENDNSLTSFWAEWGRLEEYYSVCVVEKAGKIDLDNPEIIEATTNLKNLAIEWLSDLVKKNDWPTKEVAQIIDEGWLMCPDCNEVWQLTSKDLLIICPKCSQILINPLKKI